MGCGGPSVDIHQAAKDGNIKAVKQHLADGVGVNAKQQDGFTPLHLAAFTDRMEVVELLIENGANVNAKDNVGGTSLHPAAAAGHREIAELLIAKGVDVNAKSVFGTPLDQAQVMIPASPPEIKAARKETADLLRKHGGKRGYELRKAAGN